MESISSHTNSDNQGQAVESEPNKIKQKSATKRKSTHRIGPARWERARIQFVTGELGSLGDVARHLECGHAVVWRHSQVGQWIRQRQDFTAQLAKQSSNISGLLRIELREAESKSLAETRLVIAQRLLGLVDPLLDLFAEQRLAISRAQNQEPGAVRTALVACLSSALTDTLNNLAMLAGLPEPGRMVSPAKPAAVAEPARGDINPAMLEPVSEPEAGQVEE